jgi:hypothetical protein
MICCPACGESRWVYPRRHPLGGVSKHVAGWSAYRCRACEWRGWGRVPDSDRAPVRLHYQHAWEYAARGLQRVAALPLLTRPRVAAWLVASIAIALVAAGVRFSVAKPSSQPIASAATQPVEAAPGVQEPVVPEPPSVQTAVEQLTVPDLPVATPPAEPLRVVPTAGRRRTAAAAAVAPGAPEFRGSLAINSEPAGAAVTVDGQFIGNTPVVLKDVRAGSRVVRIQSFGYEAWSAATRVVADKETRVNATLQRASQ